ncbi:PPK2 family polyphosphate kinase [Permianibacter aggregans]|uniref:Polyphosphate:AMP phosphotransferase n=1 Tax=Permianibacter aggregans TaxID=1510150 RepID=A0A4R6UKC8_9GAMM|nr:PPK2 family polyphosphate kinase [Permianibacter aggregans]QGX40188.1 polyphosphate kinase 2 family protein [Permianibacter aggregans]TDQ47440.1 polyphosphate:AMP phosphotransferase [Permianibacter aggregans]
MLFKPERYLWRRQSAPDLRQCATRLPYEDKDSRDQLKREAKDLLEESQKELIESQHRLNVIDTHAVLLILQGMDAAGKDGIIKHVLSGLNPLYCQITGFRAPSSIELEYPFLSRYVAHLPQRGHIGLFNRSWYEETVTVKIFPEFLHKQRIALEAINDRFWQHRFEDINHFEQHLTRNGIAIIKCFLHVSREEQRQRLLDRVVKPEKFWKFDPFDLETRKRWDEFMQAWNETLTATDSEHAPWHVIPADDKPMARALVARLLASTIDALPLKEKSFSETQLERIKEARMILENEKDDSAEHD